MWSVEPGTRFRRRRIGPCCVSLLLICPQRESESGLFMRGKGAGRCTLYKGFPLRVVLFTFVDLIQPLGKTHPAIVKRRRPTVPRVVTLTRWPLPRKKRLMGRPMVSPVLSVVLHVGLYFTDGSWTV